MKRPLRSRQQAPAPALEREPKPRTPEVSAEFIELAHQIATDFQAFKEGSPDVPAAIRQFDAHSEIEQLERDKFMEILGSRLNTDVEARMKRAEQAWHNKGTQTVILEPWMKAALGMDNPEQAQSIVAPTCVKRESLLETDIDNNAYWLHELEVPNTVPTPDGTTRDRMNRIIYFSRSTVVVT